MAHFIVRLKETEFGANIMWHKNYSAHGEFNV